MRTTSLRNGLHYTELGAAPVKVVVTATEADSGSALYAAIETRRFWSDLAGHEGFDTDVELHSLDHAGHSLGKLTFTLDEVSELTDDPKVSGSLSFASDSEVNKLLARLGYRSTEGSSAPDAEIEAKAEDGLEDEQTTDGISWTLDCEAHQPNSVLTYKFDATRAIKICGNDHTPPSFAYYTVDAGRSWKLSAELAFHLKRASLWHVGGATGKVFIGTPEDVDPYYATLGGLLVTSDYGKTWNEVPSPGKDWAALETIVTSAENPDCIAATVATPMRSGETAQAGLWLSRDGGASWSPAGLQGTETPISWVRILKSCNIALTANDALMIYRERSMFDRLFQR